jgi:hypothetical protein
LPKNNNINNFGVYLPPQVLYIRGGLILFISFDDEYFFKYSIAAFDCYFNYFIFALGMRNILLNCQRFYGSQIINNFFVPAVCFNKFRISSRNSDTKYYWLTINTGGLS